MCLVAVSKIQVETTGSPDVKAAGTGVLQAFKNVTTVMIPPPSDGVRQGSEGESLTVTGNDITRHNSDMKLATAFINILFASNVINIHVPILLLKG